MTVARLAFGLSLAAAVAGDAPARVNQPVAGLLERHGRVRSERRIEVGPRGARSYFRELHFLDGDWTASP